MCKKMFLLILISCSVSIFSQMRIPSDHPKIKKLVSDVSNKLMECCTTFISGKNTRFLMDKYIYYNSSTGAYTIPMRVIWNGGIIGTEYWIDGELLVYQSGFKEWVYLRDSGGLIKGCSSKCELN